MFYFQGSKPTFPLFGMCFKYRKRKWGNAALNISISSTVLTNNVTFCFQYYEHVEEAIWAVEILKQSGLPVCASLCINKEGDLHGVSPGDCAVRLAEAGI